MKKTPAQLDREIAVATNRDRTTGRYVDTNFGKMCRCGHRLGQHTAIRHGGVQPCLENDCDCESFKLARRV